MSVNIDEAIRQRWVREGLEQKFRAFWPNPAEQGVNAWNDTEARPNTPMPYCLYERGRQVLIGRSSGSTCEPGYEVEYLRFPIQFGVYAASARDGSAKGALRTGKSIAAELIGRIAPDPYGILGAYEDCKGLLTLAEPDRHIQTIVGQDFYARNDDDVWVWVQPFDIEIERRRKLRGVA